MSSLEQDFHDVQDCQDETKNAACNVARGPVPREFICLAQDLQDF